MQRIDAHHHLWKYSAQEYAWIDDTIQVLRRDFVADDLLKVLKEGAVDGSIAVQARETLEETEWLLECAQQTAAIRGVVGWLPLCEANLGDVFERFAMNPKLVGCREIVQAKPAGFLDEEHFNRGVGQLAEHSLVYDILIRRDQLQEATRFVDRHPRQTFVLDHMAKPSIAAGELEPWRRELMELGQRPNVFCKVSGLVTEANWNDWALNDLRPYLDAAVKAFGTERLLAGSDWPVCLLASGYRQWWDSLEDYLQDFSTDERDAIYGGNAIRCYRLEEQGICK